MIGDASFLECHRLEMDTSAVGLRRVNDRAAYSCSTIRSSSSAFSASGRSAYADRVSAKCVHILAPSVLPWDSKMEYFDRCGWYEESWRMTFSDQNIF